MWENWVRIWPTCKKKKSLKKSVNSSQEQYFTSAHDLQPVSIHITQCQSEFLWLSDVKQIRFLLLRMRTHANSGGRHWQSCHRSTTAWRASPGSLCRWHNAALLSDAYWNRCTPALPPELPPRSLWWSQAPALWCGPLSERVMFTWRTQAVWYQVAAAREPVL